MQIVLFDNEQWRTSFFPLTLTRPVSNLRVGILTVQEKWERYSGLKVSYLTADYLQDKFPMFAADQSILFIRGNLLPDHSLWKHISSLKEHEALCYDAKMLAIHLPGGEELAADSFDILPSGIKCVSLLSEPLSIHHPEDIFLLNGDEIRKDFKILTNGRVSAPISETNRVLGDQIFLEEGATAEFSTFNSLKGPIYLGRSSEVWEGSMVRGPFGLGDYSVLKMGTIVYSNVTVGPYSKVGGELNTSVIWGNSNKGHHGYLGSSVIGEWCNWGAGTSNSNMKNNLGNVRMYDYSSETFRDTQLGFCGMIMGDYAKSAINTSFNTGTVVGVGANVFGQLSPSKYIPDFAWGDNELYDKEKMFQTCELLFQRRNCKFDEIEKKMLNSIYQITTKNRKIKKR